MASPFKFFRKYSGGMMVVMVILSMLLFTLTDLFSDPSANLWLLGLLLGGAVFGVAGVGQGRWLQWGLGGALLGTVLGYVLPGFVSVGGLSTALGVIDEEEIYNLEIRRAVANQMIYQSTEATFGEGSGRFATLFGFGHGSREDVIFGKLLRAEADRLGITVTDSMVGAYLKRVTNDQLTAENYIDIRNRLSYNNRPLNDEILNDILRDEIKARMAYQMLRPRTTSLPPGPEVYWEYFRRLNVRQQVNVAALDVDAFLDQVGEPSEAEINELFALGAKKFPGQDEAGAPGFRLPLRASLAYVELDSEQIETEVGEVSDEDIQKYYDDNKETPMIRTPVLPDADDGDPEESKSEEKSEASGEEKTEAADDEKPAEETKPKADEPKADEPKADEPAADNTKTEAKPEEPAAETSDSQKQSSDEPSEPGDDATPSEGSDNSDEEGDEEGDSCGPFEDDEDAGSQTASDSQDDSEKTEPEATEVKSEPAQEPAADADKPKPEGTEPKAEEATPPADSEKTEAKPADAKPADAKPADAKSEEAKSEEAKPAGAPTQSLTIPAVPDKSEVDSEAPPEIQYEYRKLDDELKGEIREEILRQRVKEAIDKKMSDTIAQMETLSRERSKERFSRLEQEPERYDGNSPDQQAALRELRESMASYNVELANRLKKFANDNGLAYVETPMMSYNEFLDSEDYPVGLATEPNENPMMAGQSANVARTIFEGFSADEQNNDAQLFLARRAQLRGASLDDVSSHYAWWATDFSLSHIPTLDEPGVREAVVKAWQRMKARELVKSRGEELAQQIRDGLAKDGEERRDMAATLKEETATGKEDGPAIAVRKSLPFSWLRTSSASPMSFQRQQATLSAIRFEDTIGGQLEKAGDDFMRAVFEDLKDEDVGIVPNFDLSKYYLVHVTNRFPTPEVGEDGLRERFATEGEQFAFEQSPILGAMQQQLEGPAGLAWERSLWIRYGVDPDGEPEE